jgi:hypothetical protein
MNNNNKDNKQLREIYEQFCDVNNKIIENKSRDGIMPVCILITNKKYDCSIIGFRHRNYEEKQMARKYLFKTITESKTKGDWNLYGEWFDEDNPEHNRICNKYNKFKQEHKDKYK